MSDTNTPIIQTIAEIIINELKLEDVTPKTFDPNINLIDELGIDSMDLTTIVLELRDKFDINIDEDDYPKLSTLKLIDEYIKAKINN